MFLLRHSAESSKLNRNNIQKKISFPPLFPFHLFRVGSCLLPCLWHSCHVPRHLFTVGTYIPLLSSNCHTVSYLLILIYHHKNQGAVTTFLKSDHKGGGAWQMHLAALAGVMIYTLQPLGSSNKVRHDRQRCFPWPECLASPKLKQSLQAASDGILWKYYSESCVSKSCLPASVFCFLLICIQNTGVNVIRIHAVKLL